jgi:hypothetical protein
MTSMTVRDMRLHWPKAEKALVDPIAHVRQMQRFWKNRPAQPSTDVLLAKERDD